MTTDKTTGHPTVTVVIPVCNEIDNVSPLSDAIVKELSDASVTFELIFVDDGSTDGTAERIAEMHSNDRRIKLVRLTRNFGSHIALTAGMRAAQGRCLVYMGGDFQEPPAYLAVFLKSWQSGNEIVWGRSARRDDPFLKRFLARQFHRLFRSISNSGFSGSNYVLIDRRVLDVVNRFAEANRSMGPLIDWTGFRSTTIDYERNARATGRSKFSFGKQITAALDNIVAHSLLPVRLISLVGFIVSGLSFAVGVVFVASRLFFDTGVSGWLSVMVAVLFLGGVQMIMLGVVGEYVGRIAEEAKRRPLYIVDQALGFDELSEVSSSDPPWESGAIR